jgi:Ca2+-binding RTX toxin-like protein
MSLKRISPAAVLTVLAGLIPAHAAQAEPSVAVTATNKLLVLSTESPGRITANRQITGLQTGENVVGIDFRPLNGGLYAIGSSNRLYTIDTQTGAASQVGAAPFAPPLAGNAFGVDFNPVVDRIRVVSDQEQNLRLNPNDATTFTDVPLNPDSNVVAAAYTNNFAGAESTTLFGIDSDSDALVRQGGVGGTPSPNGGAITSIGSLGVNTSELSGFDITTGNRAFATLTAPGGSQSTLHTINLTTGAATPVGAIAGGETVRAFSVSPTAFPGACANDRPGTPGNDTITGTDAGDNVRADAGNDSVSAQLGDDCVFGEDGDDRLRGGEGGDRIDGQNGSDVLAGGDDDDRLNGGSGTDRIIGDDGNDRIYGKSDRDRIDAGAGNNTVSAGSGDDIVVTANGRRDIVNCGSGRDTIRADGADELKGCNRVKLVG